MSDMTLGDAVSTFEHQLRPAIYSQR